MYKCQSCNKLTKKIKRLEGKLSQIEKELKERLIKSEIRFLKSKVIRELVYEADIGACHDGYQPIIDRVKRLNKGR